MPGPPAAAPAAGDGPWGSAPARRRRRPGDRSALAGRASAQCRYAILSRLARFFSSQLIGPKLTAPDSLDLLSWLGRSDWFEANDSQLLVLQTTVAAHGGTITQVLVGEPCQGRHRHPEAPAGAVRLPAGQQAQQDGRGP